MKSVQINKYGGSDVIEINKNTEMPNISSDRVLVSIKAAGVNPVDWKIREGFMKEMIPLQFPSTLGMDLSGIIRQVGGQDSPTDFKEGDEVYGQASIQNGGSGAFAELALANMNIIAPKPKSLSHIEAAALPLVGVSAWQGIVENMNLSEGQKILIHGGAGGIGSIAIQLAKFLRAYVATTISADDKDFVKKLGADEVIDYKKNSFEDLLHDYDAVFDTVGGETYTKSFKVVKRNGIIVSMLEQPNTDLMGKFGVKAVFLFTQVNRERLTQLGQWVDQNNIKVNVENTFSLDEASKALNYVKDVHPRGKIVLTM
ncbi:NADP-dependent oxidoreductase [Candidatus Nitrosocosmicus arcticus]|uniref:Putative NAD-dependent alcohol dehydrogenase n=1 Tax=Candidatus Nitrosocosmicus arcticus TaxID=2035267 RepID=A0A557SWR8_9ARCH|nr:NADP-dependent oxidoreductase [Candidatus Nitrosocosmicus arcticus]TVP41046.1 putative NAD-dependent alcohol dehydrogenase [Candidatus Nitrosocosmicus arcticus]